MMDTFAAGIDRSAARGLRASPTAAIAVTAVLATLVAQVVFFHVTDAFAAPVERAAAWLLLLHLVAFLLLTLVVPRWMPAIASIPRRVLASALAVFLVAGVLATWAIPVPVAPHTQGALRITATGGKAAGATSSEVWVRLEVDGRRADPAEYRGTGWEPSGEFMLSTPATQPATLEWRGRVAENARLVFVSHPWSGQARIEWNGAVRNVDLFSTDPGDSLELPLMGAPVTDDELRYPDRSALQRWVQLVDGLLIGLVLAGAFLLMVRRDGVLPAGAQVRPLWSELLLHAAPTVVVGLTLLAFYFPALMTPDSLDQWRQAGSGHYNDGHPLLYAFLIRGLRMLWDSPAIVAGVQCISMALALGWLITLVRRASGGRFLTAHAGAWLVALHPMVALTNITIWKDVPYTVSVVVLTAYLVGIVFLQRPRLNRPLALIGLILAAVACMSLRHNGPPVAVAVLAAMWLLSKMRRQVVLAAVLSLAGLVAIKGPVADWVGSTRANATFALFSHHLAGYVDRHLAPASAADKALLSSLNKETPEWRYNCATVNTTIFDPRFDAYQASINSGRLFAIWRELALAHPEVEAAHFLCVSGLVWRMRVSDREPLYLAGAAIWAPEGRVRWIVGKPGDPVEHSLAPGAAQELGMALLKLDNDILWRPASFLYLLLFAVAVAWRRQADWRWLLVAGTCVAHSGVLVIATVAQDARYQLPVYVIALALVPALLSVPRRPRPDSAPAAVLSTGAA